MGVVIYRVGYLACLEISELVFTLIPSATGIAQEAWGYTGKEGYKEGGEGREGRTLGDFSTSTKHIRQLPAILSLS